MELPGADYLYNLSILAITFATVSALIAVVRQLKGCELSMVDVHLLTTFIGAGFAQSIAAILPPLAASLGLSGRALWQLSSGGSAALIAVAVARTQWERTSFATLGLRSQVVAIFIGLWLSVLILSLNALIPAIQGLGIHAAGVTLGLGTVMWSFVRRIASLGSDNAHGDFDLKRG